MKPSKREASSPLSPTSEKPSKKHRPLDYGGPTMEAPAAITPHGPLRNRHLQAVINAAAADGADHSLSNGHHHHHQNGHHTPITTTITQVFNDSSLSSPITVTSNSNSSTPNNLNVSKRRSIVNLNRSARKNLTSYATKEQEMTPAAALLAPRTTNAAKRRPR
ncbi:hypothetical protein TYRP_023768 [Tyrophagus putrescentiae]|nr:hypothetical protein TYRP_023768 [Tyrophagus putrescentiae]